MEEDKIIIYQTEDGQTQIDVRLENETVWLTQAQMVELFQTTKQNVSLHLNNLYKEGELKKEGTVKEYLTVQQEGKRKVSRIVKYYDLDVIISVGYRVARWPAPLWRPTLRAGQLPCPTSRIVDVRKGSFW